jgi:hypothetical protein
LVLVIVCPSCDGAVDGSDVIEAVFVAAAADGKRQHVADVRNLVEPHDFHRALPAAAEVDEDRVVADAHDRARHAGARIERRLGLRRNTFREQLVDGHSLERGLEI